MPRITDNQLKSLKSDISLTRLIQSQGYEVIAEGKDHIMNCPFHDDKTPSLKISSSKNLFNCFGCGSSGTVIDWVMKTQNLDFRSACENLMKHQGIQIEEEKPINPLAAKANNQKLLNQAIGYYHETLKQSPMALEYLKLRGLDNPELIDTFKLGYANKSYGSKIPSGKLKAGREMRQQLKDIGIFRQSGQEHLAGSLVIPVMDEENNVTEAYGRKLNNRIKPNHLYLPGPHKGIFNLASFKHCEEVILCESLIDALTFYAHGFKNVTTSYGTGGFTADILQAFKDNGIKRVLIAYDRDEAGNKAAEELSKKLNSEAIDTYRILFPKNVDANEYALNVTPAVKSLELVIRKAEWMGQGKPVDREQIAVKEKSLSPLTSQEPASGAKAQVQPAKAKSIQAEMNDHEINIELGSRSYRIRGLAKNLSYEQLKLNIHITKGDSYYIDTFDLYHAKARASYIKQASIELGQDQNIIKKDIGKILVKLEELQEAQINATLNVEKPEPTLTESQYIEAMELLKSPSLLERITSDLTASGIIGEDINKLTAYLGCVSRKLDKPLAIIIQSTSAAGKSTLMDAVLEMMPENEKVQYSALTGQSLYYMGEDFLVNKILAVSEEEGAHNASYALKLLQSEGKVSIASTGKDEATGNMETKDYCVRGPVMLFMTTTSPDIDEELLNRCMILTVNETREQTKAIHDMQRNMRTLDGLLMKQSKNKLIELHQNAQRLIQPIAIVNPYAQELTFISDQTRTRRDHMKYLSLIDTITLLHQHQREIKNINHNGETLNYIEVTKSDIAMANKLAHIVLGRSLDELPPQSRNLLKEIHQLVNQNCKVEGIDQSDYRFSRKTIRQATNWGNTQLKVHLRRLEDMEYLLVHKGGRGQSFVYELLYDGQATDGKVRLSGLIDVEKLPSDTKKSEQKQNKAVASRPQVGAKSVAGRSSKNSLLASNSVTSTQLDTKVTENAYIANKENSKTMQRPTVNGSL